MYEDLEQIARLKFGKQRESIASETRQKVQEAKRQFAARGGGVLRSGQHDAHLGQLWIDGAERTSRAMFEIWVGLVRQRNGYVGRGDVDFIAKKIEESLNAQKGNLNRVFAQQGGVVVPSLVEQASMRMYAVSANIRCDLEIMAREYEAFPRKITEEKESMRQSPKKRFSVGRRVLVGMGMRPGTVQSVADTPSTLGEFVHEVTVDGNGQARRVLGSELQPIPELDEDLRSAQPAVHIQNSNVANLNVGSQVGMINANLQAISGGGDAQREFAQAIEQLTQAVVSEGALPEEEKREVVEAIATLSEQGTKKPEERSKVTLKALVSWLPTAISAANGLVTLWDKVGPAIKAYLGI